jgi:hypothetical protein
MINNCSARLENRNACTNHTLVIWRSDALRRKATCGLIRNVALLSINIGFSSTSLSLETETILHLWQNY